MKLTVFTDRYSLENFQSGEVNSFEGYAFKREDMFEVEIDLNEFTIQADTNVARVYVSRKSKGVPSKGPRYSGVLSPADSRRARLTKFV